MTTNKEKLDIEYNCGNKKIHATKAAKAKGLTHFYVFQMPSLKWGWCAMDTQYADNLADSGTIFFNLEVEDYEYVDLTKVKVPRTPTKIIEID